jgi:hypothetical protein
MTDDPPDPPATLPESLEPILQDLSDHQLRELMDYCGALMQFHDEQLLEEIEAGPGEELVHVEERDGYTEVVKRIPCGEDCDDCPHGPYLYHVRTVPDREGGSHLKWEFIGRMR